MVAALSGALGAVAMMLTAAVAYEGRPTAVAKRDVGILLPTGQVTLPPGTSFEVLDEDGTGHLLLSHPLGEVRVSRNDVEKMETPGVGARFSGGKAIRPGDFLFPSPETEPGRTGDGHAVAVATWDKVTYLTVTIGGIRDRVSRMGDGRKGVVVFAGGNARDVKIRLRADVQLLRQATGGEASLFVFSYPEFLHGKIGGVLPPYLRGRHQARVDVRGLASHLVEQIREQTGLEDLLLVGNSIGASMLLADYAALSRDERNSFLLISPMEVCLPPLEQIGPLVRTTLLANEMTDPFTQGAAVRRWLAANKDQRVMSAMEAARDRGDPAATPLDTGHLVIGDQIDSRLLVRLVAWRLGLTEFDALEVPLVWPSFEFEGRKVILESIGSAPRTFVMFDPRFPSTRSVHRIYMPHQLGSSHQDATIVSWDFAGGQGASGPLRGLAGELVHDLRRRQVRGPIVLYGIGEWAAQLLAEYGELSKLPGVSMLLIAPPEDAMGPPPWPQLDPALAWLVANDRHDPSVRSDEFRAWVAEHKHPITDIVNRVLFQWERSNLLPVTPAANAEALAGRSLSPLHGGSLVNRLVNTIFRHPGPAAIDLLLDREAQAIPPTLEADE